MITIKEVNTKHNKFNYYRSIPHPEPNEVSKPKPGYIVEFRHQTSDSTLPIRA